MAQSLRVSPRPNSTDGFSSEPQFPHLNKVNIKTNILGARILGSLEGKQLPRRCIPGLAAPPSGHEAPGLLWDGATAAGQEVFRLCTVHSQASLGAVMTPRCS